MHLLAALLLLQSPTTPVTSRSAADGWRVGGNPPGAYMADTLEQPTTAAEAILTLRARAGVRRTAGAFGSVSKALAADTIRQRRVRVTGEIRTRDVSGGASLWLRVDGPHGAMLLLENGTDDAVRGTADWTPREVVLPVPPGAEQIVYGLLLRDGAAADVRRLRIEALPRSTAGTAVATEARTLLDSALALVRRHALWRDTVTWAVVEPQVRDLAAGAQTSREVYPAIRFLLTRLGDHHSFLQPPRSAADWQAGRVQNPEPEVRALPAGVGYVSVPAYSSGDPATGRAYAERMHRALAGVVPAALCGWVVDLRPNGGGNMYPMLAGLKPFLGNGAIGSFYRPGQAPGDPTATWIAGRGVEVEPPVALDPLEQAYVAVLTGPRTASSGEVVTVAFRGRPRTRSFGAPTVGLTTGNARFVLPDSAAILLTTSVYVDRTGTRYGAAVLPDEPVPPQGAALAESDMALDAATVWLRQASGCAATTLQRAP